MKLHFKGVYNLNPDSLPYGEHKPNAVKFKEITDAKAMSVIANFGAIGIIILLGILAFIRIGQYFDYFQLMFACLTSMLLIFPHEILHAICFKEDVYLYTYFKGGLVFVAGIESMSKARFILMSLLPNIVFGFIPFIVGMIFPQYPFFAFLGVICIGMGFGDYYNVFNAITQMPKGSRTYLHKFNSFWYMP